MRISYYSNCEAPEHNEHPVAFPKDLNYKKSFASAWILTSTCPFRDTVARNDFLAHHSIPLCHQRTKIRLCRAPTAACLPDHSKATTTASIESRHEPRKVEILPLDVVQRIAAGEVITGYDSVVQELVENSIDANAKIIKLDINLVTRTVIVQDNGVGISREQGLEHVARCNATSKLRTLDELNAGVRTLGFRGQGLWAIAMTAQKLQICSRTRDSLGGTSVVYTFDGNPREESVAPVAMAPGTIVKVTGLPWNTESVEARKVMKRCKDWLFRVALCHPIVTFHLTRNGKNAWRTVATGTSEIDGRIRLLAQELKLRPCDFRAASTLVPGVGELSIVVGIPSIVHSSSKSWMITAVNGRCLSMRSIRKAVSNRLDVRRGRYPVTFVNISVGADMVDWNVLPMKTKIKFSLATAEEKIIAAMPSLLRDALQGIFTSEEDGANLSGISPYLDDSGRARDTKSLVSLLSGVPSSISSLKSRQISLDREFSSERKESPISMIQMRVVAQLLNTYILIEHKGGVMLVEQHVADERSLYEGLLHSWKTGRFIALGEPVRLPDNLPTEWIFTLTTLGLVTCDGAHDMNEGAYEILAVPEGMSQIPRSNLLSVLLQVCRKGSTMEKASASMACRMAVKNGTSLNMREMESIVRRLLRCDNAFTCPHGRPIFLELHTKELARLFGRSWMPESVGNDDRTRKSLKGRGVLPD